MTGRPERDCVFCDIVAGRASDGALRAQVRYLIRKARALMQSEYRSLALARHAVAPGPSRRGAPSRDSHRM